jgi:hypothetical protein
MRIFEIYQQFEERGLSNSQRHFSAAWLERGENYLSQNKETDLSAEDGLKLWKNLQGEREYELAAKILTNLLGEIQ